MNIECIMSREYSVTVMHREESTDGGEADRGLQTLDGIGIWLGRSTEHGRINCS